MSKFDELVEKINAEPVTEGSGGYHKTLDKIIGNMESTTKALKEIQKKMNKLKNDKDWDGEQKAEFNKLIRDIGVLLDKQSRDRFKISISNRA
jgi:hypothetical protein